MWANALKIVIEKKQFIQFIVSAEEKRGSISMTVANHTTSKKKKKFKVKNTRIYRTLDLAGIQNTRIVRQKVSLPVLCVKRTAKRVEETTSFLPIFAVLWCVLDVREHTRPTEAAVTNPMIRWSTTQAYITIWRVNRGSGDRERRIVYYTKLAGNKNNRFVIRLCSNSPYTRQCNNSIITTWIIMINDRFVSGTTSTRGRVTTSAAAVAEFQTITI